MYFQNVIDLGYFIQVTRLSFFTIYWLKIYFRKNAVTLWKIQRVWKKGSLKSLTVLQKKVI